MPQTYSEQTSDPQFLARNIAVFAHILRRAGASSAPGATLDALAALEAIGLDRREDVRAALRCTLVKQCEHGRIFDEIFESFWRRWDQAVQRSPEEAAQTKPQPKLESSRHAQAPDDIGVAPRASERAEARWVASSVEILRAKDFAQMSADEISAARVAISRLICADASKISRRYQSATRGAFDPRASFRASTRANAMRLAFRRPMLKPAPIVALCDVSGSMSDYTQIFLRFLHALTQQRPQTHSFLFGTRLTNVSRALRKKEPDVALSRCAAMVKDWEGGTRIGTSLRAFNRQWLRRLMTDGALCLLFTDGLERDGIQLLEEEIAFLSRFCRRLIWLNPLLRYEDFSPKAAGVRAILRHVDEFRPIHNLSSVESLALALDSNPKRRRDGIGEFSRGGSNP